MSGRNRGGNRGGRGGGGRGPNPNPNPNRQGGGQQGNRNGNGNRNNQRGRGPNPNQQRQQQQRQQEEKIPPFVHQFRRYGLVVYDTFQAAKADLATIAQKQQEFEQLNICIRQEGDMEDPELTKFGKVFAGEAWALIHDRRVADGWYNEPR